MTYTLADFERHLLARLDKARQEEAKHEAAGPDGDRLALGMATGAVIELKCLLTELWHETGGKHGRTWEQFDTKATQTTTPQGGEASKQ
ncbi:hypothetical protein [Amycolatopsis pigmentata]|uniref:Uncharacterized protein n=1 Tax=Amycolatopsis pigmentata TaxID=450801 RepID=A0ABW5G2R8_9PSEU